VVPDVLEHVVLGLGPRHALNLAGPALEQRIGFLLCGLRGLGRIGDVSQHLVSGFERPGRDHVVKLPELTGDTRRLAEILSPQGSHVAHAHQALASRGRHAGLHDLFRHLETLGDGFPGGLSGCDTARVLAARPCVRQGVVRSQHPDDLHQVRQGVRPDGPGVRQHRDVRALADFVPQRRVPHGREDALERGRIIQSNVGQGLHHLGPIRLGHPLALFEHVRPEEAFALGVGFSRADPADVPHVLEQLLDSLARAWGASILEGLVHLRPDTSQVPSQKLLL
jgi:hypothetical protein